MNKHNRFAGQKGITILEVLIAALITGIMASAAFNFYSKMHGQSETQYNVSEMQQICRSSLYEIRNSLLQAGYKVTGPPYKISGDTLTVYYSGTQPVDTLKYYLVEFIAGEYSAVPELPAGNKLYKLLKKVNGAAPVVFADFVKTINYNQIDPANVIVTITVQANHADESYAPNNGFRIYSVSERIHIRNVS